MRSDAPWDYISRAETAISRFSTAADWTPIDGEDDDEDDDEDEDENEDEDAEGEPEREDTGEPPLHV